jgi:DNA-binding transcriptional ArsR family regulator
MNPVHRLDDSVAAHRDSHRLRIHERGSVRAGEWPGTLVCFGSVDHWDYEADETLVVDDPERLRALADDLRAKIVTLLREHALSTTELAEQLGLPKGTVGHHVKVLERAGLIRVVRTRQVRAVTEKYYGRVARLFLLQSTDDASDQGAVAAGIRTAADELARGGDVLGSASIHLRLSPRDARRFERRLRNLVTDMRASETPEGERFGLAALFYRREAR